VWSTTFTFYNFPERVLRNYHSFIDLLNHCLSIPKLSTTRLVVLYEITFAIWKACNKKVYERTERSVSPLALARTTSMHIEALLDYCAQWHGQEVETLGVLSTIESSHQSTIRSVMCSLNLTIPPSFM
jgi:hypothetical protein